MKFGSHITIVLKKINISIYNLRVALLGCGVVLFGVIVNYIVMDSNVGWVYIAGGINLMTLLNVKVQK